MGGTGVDQLQPLRSVLAHVYQEARPRRVAVLGCGPGGGLDVIDPERTDRFVGVDLNPDYLALARQRHPQLGGVAEWICTAVEECELAPASFDLIHAVLLFEYLDPSPVMARIAPWLAPRGLLSIVLQLPGGDAAISATGFSSLQRLSGLMHLVPPDQLCALAAREGLVLQGSTEIPLAREKRFWAGRFTRP